MDFKKFEKFIKEQHKFFRNNEKDINSREHILFRTIKIGEEYGELCDAVLERIGTQRKSKSKKYETDSLESEFADVLITTFLLAEALNVDILPALEKKIKKIKEKYNKELKPKRRR
jgi:NTP pyrophosphatase (non-canonical NTP hydrolase)